jgi:glycine hydroxymethyltransferase
MAMGGKETLRAKVEATAVARARAIVRQLRGVTPTPPTSDTLAIRGEEVARFLNYACASDVLALGDGEAQGTVLSVNGTAVHGHLSRQSASHYTLTLPDMESAGQTRTWLRDLSDGYLRFDEDVYAKIPGPVTITFAEPSGETVMADSAVIAPTKPYYIGHRHHEGGAVLPEFSWTEPEDSPLLQTSLHQTHVDMGAKMVPFAGYDMPVWYTSVSEEHKAVRETAGLFDVTHMGTLDASGPHVVEFLNTVLSNDVTNLAIGQSHYTYLLLPDGSVVDDLLVYRLGEERFMLVVNASNNDKDWAWLNAVNEGKVMIDGERPFAHIQHPITLRDLRDPQHGDDCRVDIALQGPRATDILLALCDDPALAKRIKGLPWAGLLEGNVGGFDLVVSRTGYTGERVAYELFVHPDKAPEFWQALMRVGEPFGLKPCGLAARDSTRTEAGLPLYGHELAGPLGLNPAQAGFGAYVKLWKPFFIGRSAFIAKEQNRDNVVVRFRMNEKGVRRAELGDPVLDKRGKVVGTVTSCAIDVEGYLLGQAVVPESMSAPETPLAIYQLGGGTREIQVPKAVKLGAKLPTPDGATVLTRFPSRKKK